MKQTPDLKEPPRLAAKFWDEFSGKQTVLSAFFGKQAASEKESGTASTQQTPTPPPPTQTPTASQTSDLSTSVPPIETAHADLPADPPKKFKPSQTSRVSSQTAKRKSAISSSSGSAPKKQKQAKGQASIAAFFSKPPAATTSSQKADPPEIIDVDEGSVAEITSSQPLPSQAYGEDPDQDQLDADYRLARELAAAPDSDTASQSAETHNKEKGKDKSAWSALFARVPPPRCTVHGEPAKLYTVNKPGPNKGKTFYICARPVGPGWDRGRNERPREEVDHRYKCNYFKWASEARREAMRDMEREKGKSGPARGS